ncbi:MAG: TIGR04076 family protein [Christensenella sp.]|nr:TIGR04076 family protein [Christensenella sp.]
MAQKYPVKITVYRKFDCDELPDYSGGCHAFDEGAQFMVQTDGKMPEGFCTWAWNDIYPVVMTLRFGGEFTYCKEGKMMYSACSDGLSPVVFRLERIED